MKNIFKTVLKAIAASCAAIVIFATSVPAFGKITPDKPVMNLKGKVSCEGKGVPGVVVSDGFSVAKTDKDGFYYLASDKKTGYVFLSIPSGYIIKEREGNTPAFYCKTDRYSPESVERHDFPLIKDDKSDYVLLAMADFHIAGRCNDTESYKKAVLVDINRTVKEYEAEGKRVCGLTLGDISWDKFWYKNSFFPDTVKKYIDMIDCPVFNCMGNHDNNPRISNDDFKASLVYSKSFGPTYYSFNMGPVHCIVLDNIFYINDGACADRNGKRNYICKITDSQLVWMEKDLGTLKNKDTPLIIAMHAPLFKRPSGKNGYEHKYALQNAEEVVSLLKDYKDVTFLSGHIHTNYNTLDGNIREHNIAAICATWWWTSKKGNAGNYICKDGSPAGYDVWEFDTENGKIKKTCSYYKSVNYARSYQFRTYDLNETYFSEKSPRADEIKDIAGRYFGKKNSNRVLINVFNYNPDWKIEVWDQGKLLPVKRIEAKDPLHILSYEMQMISHGNDPSKVGRTPKISHMFEVKASSPSSTLRIRVTDDRGNVFEQNMKRPKRFFTGME